MSHRHVNPRLSALLALPLLAGCGTPVDEQEAPTLARVRTEVFAVSCATSGCHAGPVLQASLGLVLDRTTQRELLTGQTAHSTYWPEELQGLKVVEPGVPERSALMLTLQGGPQLPRSLHMPPTGPLTESQKELVRRWIAAGAP